MYWDRRPILTRLADKIAVRDYVAACIGEQHLTKLYAVTDNPSTIDFATLPQSFVIKPNHASSQVMIVPDKDSFDPDKFIPVFHQWLRQNFYDNYREWHYKHIPPKILIEEYLTDLFSIADEPEIYKVFCFDGEPKYIFVVLMRDSVSYRNFYWLDWRQIPVKQQIHPNYPAPVPKPPLLEEMLAISRHLSTGIDHVRVDLFAIGNRIIFNELTFTHDAGRVAHIPYSFDSLFGSFWNLPPRRQMRGTIQ